MEEREKKAEKRNSSMKYSTTQAIEPLNTFHAS